MWLPSWCRFPIIGSFGGDGGKFFADLELSLDRRRLNMAGKASSMKNASMGMKNHKDMVSFRKLVIGFCFRILITRVRKNVYDAGEGKTISCYYLRKKENSLMYI